MDWMQLLFDAIEVCVIPLLGLLTNYLVRWLKAKIDNEILEKYVDMLSETISDCVLATKQTYVDALKAEGKFDAEAQKQAFDMTYAAVMDILNDDAKEYLQVAYGDLAAYITKKIEKEVLLSGTISK